MTDLLASRESAAYDFPMTNPIAALKGTVFYKMSGSGNDFIMFDGRRTTVEAITPPVVVALCHRRLGVGADGVVVLTPVDGGTVRMDFWNCDGSRADMCGNAALCSTRLAAFLEMAPGAEMRLLTGAGTFPAMCPPDGDEAQLHLPDFPLPSAPATLGLGPDERLGMLSKVGVPHLVLEVGDLERPDLMARGRELRYHDGVGPAGANVNFVAPDGESGRWCLRTYERGVEGETLACGTGAVAAAVSLAAAGRSSMPVQVTTRSGRVLHITATLSNGLAADVWLRGEGRLVFTGVL